MAERDGTIVIDTQIDTKGVDAGSEKTEASLRRIKVFLIPFRLPLLPKPKKK